MNRNRALILVLVILLTLGFLSACMPNPAMAVHTHPAGFFKGVWHGWIAPFSLIVGFFNDNIRIYEPNNTGWWYDFGFYMAIISGFGGLSLVRRKQDDRL
ncbi:MAG: hypothetical protein K9M49_01565 [Candidatus Marinimicrobia bacterium]|nr:hypothetical protein [Candidatus Neomarinimicrobiota bacterium]MCF7850287.1 hypothetical protein [Candidatus Neomarinimicrobiota bacterium]MCF7903816.1 hypothetical protein [Candidatus Neomarinimicrobiota bacterium]